jgi:alkyl sulfatase BDS1-like metallo-beta-lactamase superfamily hydrolase
MADLPSPASSIIRAHAAARDELPFDDTRDFEDARRGFLGTLADPVIRADDGTVVWDAGAYAFLDGDCPDTVHPSLWRQGQLVRQHGLFEITPGVYQVRGLDLSSMTIVEGDEGVLVVDPLISVECAAAALALYREHRGDRPVTAVLYTHSHVDHFGGVRGVVSAEDVETGRVPLLAPAGFMEHAISENVYAGGAMVRRATYMYGALLPKGPAGQVGTGLGQTTSSGTVSLLAPTREITATGEEVTVDGIRMIFQLTPNTEAPAEMNFLLPDLRALCVAENATHHLHNVGTLRGAQVRDAHAWSSYLDETIELFADRADVAFAQHHWPCWGRERIVEFLSLQRDLYGYIHDQTLRLMNKGLVADEIADELTLPPALQQAWHCREYYGSVSHNARAVYQRYLGFFDGNPAHLWRHPPVAAAQRYVKLAGGADAALTHARNAYAEDDFRWAAELASHIVFADPEHQEAREFLAQTLEQLAYGAENGTWRNFFLMGALELREGPQGTATEVPPDLVSRLSDEQLWSAMAVRIDGPRAAENPLSMLVDFTDTGVQWLLTVSNGVLSYRRAREGAVADVTLTVERTAFDAMIAQTEDLADLIAAGRFAVSGDGEKLGVLLGLMDPPDPAFAIVTP